MTFIHNAEKEERINRFGPTVDLPLFNQENELPPVQHPGWLWSGNGIKAEIYNRMKDTFADNAFEYLQALINLGGRATDHEVKEYLNNPERWPLHIVSARRNDLMKAPFFVVTSYPNQKRMGPNRMPNTIWFINYKNLFNLTLE